MSGAQLFVDLTQFVSEPARSGVQRALTELMRNWPTAGIATDIGYAANGTYAIVPREHAADALRGHFETGSATAGPASRLDRCVTARVAAGELVSRYSAYLLPEPSYRAEVLDVLCQWRRERPRSTFALFFDALPLTDPQHFRAPHQLATSRYFRELSQVENVACISAASLNTLVGRLRRRPASNAMVLPLGADALASGAAVKPSAPPAFVCVATVEPRKNHAVILAAFNRLWRAGVDFHLHFIGAQGACPDAFLADLSNLLATEPTRFRWSRQTNDADVRDALSQATAALFLSEAEGYGLPAVEALAVGCPVIVPSSLPALANLPALGQLRLDAVSVDTVAEAVRQMAEPDVNARLRQEASKLRLPTWRAAAEQLAQWIRITFDCAAAELNGSGGA